MTRFPDLGTYSMVAELNYRRERLMGSHYPGEPRVHRSRIRRSRVRTAA
jgi:hypothetical protein